MMSVLRYRKWFCWLAAVVFPVTSAYGSDSLVSALQSGSVFGYAKAMYVADDKKGGRPNQEAPGFGGKLGAETGSYHGFKLRGAWYTTQDFGLRSGNPRQTDAYMFDLDKRPYSLLGEAQIVFAAGKTTLILGRQEFHSPLINSYEYRIIPNLFEAYTLTQRSSADTTLTLSYVSRMSGLDGLVTFSEFRSMSQQAYTSLMVAANGMVDARNGETLDLSRVIGHKGVWVAGFEYQKDHALRVWNYHGTDTLNTLYLDGKLKSSLSPQLVAMLEAQAYRVSAVGQFENYLARRGLNADYWLHGVKATLAHKPSGWSTSLAYNRFTGDRNTVTAHGNWGGYPEFVSMPYMFAERDGVSAIAGSHLAKFTALLDLGTYGFKDQSLLFGHAHIDIDEAILPGSDIHVNTLLYRAKLTSRLSARIALEARNSGNSRYDNEFVAISLRYDF